MSVEPSGRLTRSQTKIMNEQFCTLFEEIKKQREEQEKQRLQDKELERKVNELEKKTKKLETGQNLGINVAVQRVKPPTFDGQISWPLYKRQFEAAAEMNCWNDEEKALALVLALREPALQMLQNIPECDQKNYHAITDALELRYGDRHMNVAYQSLLRSKQQKSNERLQEYAAEIDRLVNLAFPSAPMEVRNQIVTGAFIDGLRDVDLQHYLRLQKFETCADALRHGLEYEVANKLSHRMTQRVRGVCAEEAPTGNNNLLQQFRAVLEEMLQVPRRTAGRPRCFNCGKIGHLRRECYQGKPGEVRRESEDWGELPSSPPLMRSSLSQVKTTQIRPKLARWQSRQLTLGNTSSSDEVDCVKLSDIVEFNNKINEQNVAINDLQKQLTKSVEERRSLEKEIDRLKKVQAKAVIQEKKFKELALAFERTECELNQRNSQAEFKFTKGLRSLEHKLSETEDLAVSYEEKCANLSHELQTKQRTLGNLQEELSNTNEGFRRLRDENDRLFKRVQNRDGTKILELLFWNRYAVTVPRNCSVIL